LEIAGAEVSRGLDDARQALEELEQLERREAMKRQAVEPRLERLDVPLEVSKWLVSRL